MAFAPITLPRFALRSSSPRQEGKAVVVVASHLQSRSNMYGGEEED